MEPAEDCSVVVRNTGARGLTRSVNAGSIGGRVCVGALTDGSFGTLKKELEGLMPCGKDGSS